MLCDVSIVLGIAAALFIGLSDAFGRASSRRDESSVTHVTMQMAVGTLVALPFTVLIDSSFVTRDVLLGALSGITVAIGLAIVYRAAADSSSAVTIPLAGVIAILVPFIFDLAGGERISTLAAIGCAVAIGSIAVVSFDPKINAELLRRGLGMAFVGGCFFGLTFLFAGSTSEASGAWPAVANRGVGLVGIAVLAKVQQAPLLLSPSVRKFGMAGGIAGAVGMLALIVGTQIGSLAIVSVLAGSSPVVTVLLSSQFDDDSVSVTQLLGVAGTIAGATMIALGS